MPIAFAKLAGSASSTASPVSHAAVASTLPPLGGFVAPVPSSGPDPPRIPAPGSEPVDLVLCPVVDGAGAAEHAAAGHAVRSVPRSESFTRLTMIEVLGS